MSVTHGDLLENVSSVQEHRQPLCAEECPHEAELREEDRPAVLREPGLQMGQLHLGPVQKAQPLIGEVRGKGLMIGVELIADRKTKAYGTAAAGFVRQYCLEHNLLIGVGGNFGSVLRIQPPLVISEEQIDTVFATVADGLAAFAAC
jgi:4-aminobutyrate aminotransferase-like enzyme